ncbi:MULTISPECIES: Xaa-Pro peptidase family protein [Mesorhizobium]|uniref:M24 family metallopeptidase n=1 Tax=Mesorhizobium TaxID=68287 RepID=UPI000BAECA8B|nr:MULTISPECIES: Xaa-Pro peptidase family protein [Mesorhizobium]PBB58167.1 peptidase M24 [Mesorhizobium loti]PBB83356.1 peptidase M24 [Mesorhizobium sp. WSM3876]
MDSHDKVTESKRAPILPITLSARSIAPSPTVSVAELEMRLARVRTEMDKEQIDVIVLTDPKNVQYFTGYRSITLLNKTRPIFVMLTQERLVLVGSLDVTNVFQGLTSTVLPITYLGYLDEAVGALTEQIAAMPLFRKCIGIDYGQDMLGHGSLTLVNQLKDLSFDGVVKSANDVLWRVRMIKTPFEVEMKKIGLDIINRAFNHAVAHAYLGISEMQFYQILQAEIYLNGAEESDPFTILFSEGNDCYGRWPSDLRLRDGHYIWADFYATYGGYPTDRNRIVRCGEPADWEIDAYVRVRSLTMELAKSVRPGMRCCDVYGQFQRLWKEANLGPAYGLVSRIGHGSGLDILEPPSISATDETVIEVGMILNLEPKLEKNGAVFQFEDILFVRDDGVEFLSDPHPEHLPVIKLADK